MTFQDFQDCLNYSMTFPGFPWPLVTLMLTFVFLVPFNTILYNFCLTVSLSGLCTTFHKIFFGKSDFSNKLTSNAPMQKYLLNKQILGNLGYLFEPCNLPQTRLISCFILEIFSSQSSFFWFSENSSLNRRNKIAGGHNKQPKIIWKKKISLLLKNITKHTYWSPSN